MKISIIILFKLVYPGRKFTYFSIEKNVDKSVNIVIENNTWARIDMEFLFECLTWWLTSEISSWTREENSISTSNHVLFCLSYKHKSPLLRRKADFINEWK